MRRASVSVAAVLIALGTAAPMVQAATVKGVAYSKETLSFGSYQVATSELIQSGRHTGTDYLPVWYLMQGLKANGYEVAWNGKTQRLNIKVPYGIPTNLKKIPSSLRSAGIYLNDILVERVTPVVAKDPATKRETAYVPLAAVQKSLSRVGLNLTVGSGTAQLSPSNQYPVVLAAGQTYGPTSGQKYVNKNVLLLGNNANLQNLNITGSVYINPGKNGSATLSNVTVGGQIVIESGADHSVHLDNVSAPDLVVSSSSAVHVVSAGKTDIKKTQVTSKDQQPVSFENDGGVFGNLYIQSGQNIVLTGKVPYTNITVESGATVTIGNGAMVMNLTVDSNNANITVAKGASVDAVNVQAGSNVKLSVDGTVNTVSNDGSGSVSLAGSGVVTAVQGKGVTGTTAGGTGTTSPGQGTTGQGTGSSTSGSGSTSTSGSTGGTSGSTTGSTGTSGGTGGTSGSTTGTTGSSSGDGSGNGSGSGSSSSTSGSSGSQTTTAAVYNPTAGLAPNNLTLATPKILKVSNGTVTWTPVQDATGYSVDVTDSNGTDVGDSSSFDATSVNLNQWGFSTGTYSVKVEATAADSIYKTSAYSDPETVTISELAAPTNVTVSGSTVSWDPVKNADSYYVQAVAYNPSVTGSVYGAVYNLPTGDTVLTNSIDLAKAGIPNGTYELNISAADSTGRYSSSIQAWSAPVTVTNSVYKSVYVSTLSTPTDITVDGTLVTFNAVKGATGYEIDIMNSQHTNTWGWFYDAQQGEVPNAPGKEAYNITGFGFAVNPNEKYSLDVRATGSGQYANSPVSTPIPIAMTQLQAPSGVSLNDNTLTWQPVANATGYNIAFVDENGGSWPMTSVSGSSTSVDLSKLNVSSMPAGTYSITVSATYSDSTKGVMESLGAAGGSVTIVVK